MKILIVSELLDPQNNIGAVRTFNFSVGLANSGHKVFCVASESEKDSKISEENNNVRVCYVEYGKLGKKRNNYVVQGGSTSGKVTKKPRKHSKIVSLIRRTLAQTWIMLKEFEWKKKALVECSQIIENESIDVVLSSYGPISNLLLGICIKKKYPSIVWISDMRDPADSIHQQWPIRLYGSVLQKKMLRLADVVTTVCDGICEKYVHLMGEKYRNKIFVLPNGYCDSPVCYKPENDGILRVGYTGQLYKGTRDMSELFRCIKAIELKTKEKPPIQIHYAGSDAGILYKQAEPYDCQDYIVNHGKVSKSDALKLQEQCDVLCVLTWNTKKEQGVLTGKFPEYLRLRKPILAIVIGNLKDAEITQRIAALNIGYSFECINETEGFGKLENWIEECIDNKLAGKMIVKDINEGLVKQYSYDYLVNRLEKVVTNRYNED